MLFGNKGVKYGLQPGPGAKKKRPTVLTPIAAFAGADDDDYDNVGAQVARHAASKATDSKVAALHAAAEAELSDVYDYDGYLEKTEGKKAELKKAEPVVRRSRYISTLLEKAEDRKKEEAIIFDRRKKKEHEAEQHLFGDKEAFVTGAYKRYQAEQAKYAADLNERDARDAANAPDKRGNMAGFYSNLLHKNVAFASNRVSDADPAAEKATAAKSVSVAVAESDAAPSGASPTADGAPKSSWEKAERARSAAASQAARTPSEGGDQQLAGTVSAASAQPPEVPGKGDLARSSVVSAGGNERRPIDSMPPSDDQENDTEAVAAAVAAEVAAAAAKAQAAGERRNDNDRVAAARERFLARKRKAPAA